MACGYSVGEKQSLSMASRQEILADIIDMEILRVWEIVNLLDFFCTSHTGEHNRAAREKWQEDREFVKSYKVNPSRFMIAESTGLKGL